MLRAYKYKVHAGDKEKIMANVKESTAGYRILTKESNLEGTLDFDYKAAVEEKKD